MRSTSTRPNTLYPQLTSINTQALHTIKDQQLQILTAIIPLLPMLQKVPLHIASAEANLKEAIRNAALSPNIASTQPMRTGSISGTRKRKLSKNADQHSPSPSVAKKRRIRVDSNGTAQQQIPSPKSSRDSLLTQSGLPMVNQHRSVGDALYPDNRSASCSINTAQTPNPGQRLSMQPPTPRIVPTTPSRMHSIALSDRIAQPSSLSHRKERMSNVPAAPHFARPVSSANSATSAPPNSQKDAFKAPNQFYTHTPLRTGSNHPNDWSKRPSAPPPAPIGFSAVRRLLTRNPLSVPHLPVPPFLLLSSDQENASFQSRTMTMKFLMIDARKSAVFRLSSF